ncbi:helix-turn-helix domain-containing protein [Flavobacterium notoginsengisoli]|uniref:helix-turn-helix domain-containing protein n=1 Tax=Flavobacterium notoginsengisoli TaxID=1478199 RepID=UPI00362F7FD2
MNLKLYDDSPSNILFEKEYPGSFYFAEDGLNETIIHLEHPFGQGYYKEIYFEGVHIGFGNAQMREKMQLSFESDFETIEMHFSLKGKSTAMAEKFDKAISFETHQHNIVYANAMCGKMNWESDHFQLCEINLSPIFFKKFITQDTALFDTFRNNIEKGKSSLISSQNYRASHQMYQIIYEIMHCERKGTFKRMFLEAKVIELLLLQLEQFSTDASSSTSLKKSDIDKIYSVREFMLHNLDSASSLIELAHKAGTNEFTLKKGFKELFGTTVFGFWNDTKMEQAKLLILDQNMNISEVANVVGYKNHRHFSAAFKKKFGIVPSQLKKM